MTSLSLTQSSIAERFPCPHKGCKAVLRSKVSFEIHFKYFHKVSVDKESAQKSEKDKIHADKEYCSSSKETPRPYCCEEKECANKSGRKNSFKCYAALKQHYLNFHAKKMFTCKKCGKMFSEDAKKTRHEFDCSVSFVCSCGISFSGKNGLFLHVKRTRHKIPQAVEEYLCQKHERKRLDKKTEEKKKLRPIVSALPKGAFSTPSLTFKKKGAAPILPKFFPLKSNDNTSFSAVTSNCIVPDLSFNQLMRSRVVIDIYHPPEVGGKLPSRGKLNFGPLKKAPYLLAPKTLDSLSVAMVKSGIAQSNEPPRGIPPLNDCCIQSKTSQTDWTVTNQSAQDFSCQTDEFLAWLDSESARCSSRESGIGYSLDINMERKTSEHQFDNDGESSIVSNLNHANVRTVVQHETQTDDDWLSALLHETESIGNEVSDAESQTNTVNCRNFGVAFNTNANNNHACTDVLPDGGCDIETQTRFLDSMADVTTQTASLPVALYGMSTDNTSTSPIFFNLASDIQTQTETEISLVNTTHTQTAWQSDSDITEFFNTETQTDSFASNGIQLTAAQT